MGLPVDSHLADDQQSVFLKYLLLGELEDVGGWRRRWQRDPRQTGPALYRCLEASLQVGLETLRGGPQVAWCGASPQYRQRVIELAAAAVFSEQLAPEVCIAPVPVKAATLDLAGRWYHALCFAAAPLFPHEFYPLVVDALARDATRHGRPRFALLGVHLDWLSPAGQIRRLLCLDVERGYFREAELVQPLIPHSAHFLCLGRREQELHAQWSARLPCPQINPAGLAALADDKARTLEGWRAAGVRVPGWQRSVPGDVEGARCFLRACGELVVKPNQGTEGEGVAFFSSDDETGLERQLEVLWAQGGVLLQERADDLLYCDPQTGEQHTLALRLNVIAEGGRYWAESGYAQVGTGAHSPAAGSHGSMLWPIDAVLPHLVRRRDGRPVPIPEQAWAAVLGEAEQAARLFVGLMLVGLDLVLAVGESGVPVSVFLEANPRPAGLSHSRFVQGPECGLPGVSLKLWDALERLVPGANGGGSCERAKE
ncbi:MAG: hypothetical protein EXS58_16700 [Candidatus Latescibacteria bacterium]|nr:hypothetical protein [Candidatus Latescibacterota bacterium]